MEKIQFEKMVEQYKQKLMEMATRQPKPAASLSLVTSKQQPVVSTPGTPQSQIENEPRNPAGQPQDQGDGQNIQQGTTVQSNRDTIPSSPPQNDKEAGPDPIMEIMTYEEFMELNPKWGSLKIQAFTGRAAFPVVGAQISIDRDFSDGPKNFYKLQTDSDGIADNINLPAPDKSLSQHPSPEQPFATYNITVTHPDYHTEVYKNTPVFDGVKSILPVRMIPKNLPQE